MPPVRRGLYFGVVGAGSPDPSAEVLAEAIGRQVAEIGGIVVCGGLGGVMAAACRGAVEAGGMTVGILPGDDRLSANRWVRIAVATGLGELRNWLVVRSADVVIAVGGEYGTLSEVALALKLGRPVVGLGTWELRRPDGGGEPGIVTATSPEEAVRRATELATPESSGTL